MKISDHDGLLIHSGRKLAVRGEALVGTSICPDCDMTHLEISWPDSKVAFITAFYPEDAERLAAALLNPQPYRKNT